MPGFENISIIIPTINEPTLEAVVKAACDQMPGAQVIVAGFGPAGKVAAQYRASFIDTGKKTPKPIVINQAVRMSIRDWFIILDADAVPLPGWGKSMLQGFIEGQQLFTGSVEFGQGSYWTKVYNLSYFHEVTPERRPQSLRSIPAINMGFTRAAFEYIGAWNESDVRSQDYDWSLRAHRVGISPFLLPGARVIHLSSGRNSFRQIWNSWARNAFYNWRVRMRHKDVLRTPFILKFPLLILLFSPALAIWPTIRILRTSPRYFFKYIYLIPAVYLTKIAWCWGVFYTSWEKTHHQSA
jgi:GT2 family glycosyltransferase